MGQINSAYIEWFAWQEIFANGEVLTIGMAHMEGQIDNHVAFELEMGI